MTKEDLKKMSRTELIEFIRQNRIFSQKELAEYFNTTRSIISNELVKKKVKLIQIRRQEIEKYLRKYPTDKLDDIGDKFGVNFATISRIKRKLGLNGAGFIKYNKISKRKLKKMYKLCDGSISCIVKRFGGTATKWKDILIKRGIYDEKISGKYLKKGYAEKFKKELEKRGKSLLYAKPETIAKLIGCSVSYVKKLLKKYKELLDE